MLNGLRERVEKKSGMQEASKKEVLKVLDEAVKA
jgi:hypothetical protein